MKQSALAPRVHRVSEEVIGPQSALRGTILDR